MFADEQPFDVTLNFDEYTLDPSLERWKDHLPISPVGLVVDAVWRTPCGIPADCKWSARKSSRPPNKAAALTHRRKIHGLEVEPVGFRV